MSDILLDTLTNDLIVEGGQITLIDNREELARQRLLITLRTFRGEWFKNINFGVPYIENDNNKIALLGKSSKRLLDIELQRQILDIEDIESIEDYTSVLDTISREIVVTFSAVTKSGAILPLSLTI